MTGYLIGAGIIVFVWLATIMKAVLWGAGKERDKQAARENEARDISDEINDAVAGRSPEDNRGRLKQWFGR